MCQNPIDADFWYNKYWRKKETNIFVSWFEKEYGHNSDFDPEYDEQEEYWLRRGFALMGWLGHQSLIENMKALTIW